MTGTRQLCSVSNSRKVEVPMPRGQSTKRLARKVSAYSFLSSAWPAVLVQIGWVRSTNTSWRFHAVANSRARVRDVRLPWKLNR
jgi:hypothetical protein